VQFHFTTIRAFEWRGDIAGTGQAATFAEGWLDEMHLGTAVRADEAIARRGMFGPAKLADFGIKECEPNIEASPHSFKQRRHREMVNGAAAILGSSQAKARVGSCSHGANTAPPTNTTAM
jgi:hypothetical protein